MLQQKISSSSFRSLLLFLFAFLFAVGAIIILSSFSPHQYSLSVFQRAYADGLTAENLPPATVGDREASLFVKINPAILTTESQENAFLQLRLFDERNNQTIQFVTYEIAIRKANAPQDSRPLLRDFFHAPNGLLTIKVDPTESGTVQVFGDRDPFQNALMADPGGTVNIRGPILIDGGLYHIEVRIFGIDNVRNIFIPENAPRFDSYLSIGDITYHNLTYNGRDYNSTLISYYDEIEDFNYDPGAKQISWSMPFDWNTTRIQDQNIFVHEEIKLPNSFLEDEFGSKSATIFDATVNGQPLLGRALAVDPFTSSNATIIHYLINKNQILELAAGVKDSNNTSAINTSAINASASVPSQQQGEVDLMLFSLSPKIRGNATQPTSSDLTTDTGGIHAAVSWEPRQLTAGTDSTVKINFSDAFSGEALNADVLYDLVILNSNGTQVFQRQNITAINASDSQTVTFPSEEIYQIELNVKGLVPSNEASAAPDTTRSGIARGFVVVPEFPSG